MPPNTPSSSSPLFRLPRDIRCQIWRHLLHTPSEIPWPTPTQTLSLSTAILVVNKAIYQEAAYILYTTNTLCFSHPSDANMFAHALSSRTHSLSIPSVTLRIRSQETRLWTAWFNTNAPERSLSQDLPCLKQLTIRYRGPRWQPALNEKANAELWLKDPKLQEIILSVRKCVLTVRLLLCVRLPTEMRDVLMGGGGGQGEEGEAEDRLLSHAMFRKWAWLNGCYIRVEPIGKDDEWESMNE